MQDYREGGEDRRCLYWKTKLRVLPRQEQEHYKLRREELTENKPTIKSQRMAKTTSSLI